ncbi:MAG: ABC transporter permease [Oligosphaeraceae bacterium]
MTSSRQGLFRTPWALLPPLILLLVWGLLSWLNQGRVLPSPRESLLALGRLLCTGDTWRSLALTLARGSGGLALGGTIGLALGLFCGRHPRLHDALSPMVTLAQGCPPIVWISLLLVWLSLGGAIPLAVSTLSVLPVIFIQTANAVRGMDPRWFEVAQVYRVGPWRRCRHLILPGIAHPLAGAFSYACGITWKVTATAEFFGATDGIGAQIYQSYRDLALERLFAWTLLIASLGIAIDALLVRRLRRL